MKRFFFTLVLVFATIVSFGQQSKIPQRLEIAEVEINNGDVNLEVFKVPSDDGLRYFLSVGNLGIGDDVVQIQFDPIFELFIPLGNSLAEAMETLAQLQSVYKKTPGDSVEVEGCLALAFPNENRESVKVTCRKYLLRRMLEFSVEREGYIRSTHIYKSDFSSLMTSMKIYRKIHPKEQ